MASIRERTKKDGKKVFHVQVRMVGYPARTASFRTRRAAERWVTTTEAEMIDGKHFRNVEARRRTLGDAIDRYIKEELPRKRDGAMHKSRLPWWKKHAGTVKLADVTPALIVELRGKLKREPFLRANPKAKRTSLRKGEAPKEFKRSDATVNRFLAVLSHVFTIARKEWHWMSHNPMDGVSKFREGKGRVRYLSTDERAALLEETAESPTLHTFVVIALSTACRAGELVNLRWLDVDLQEGRLLFRETKNAEPRVAWLHGEAMRLLTEHAKARPTESEDETPPKGADRRVFEGADKGAYDYLTPFKGAVQAAGLKNFRFHDLRHSAATYLAMEGATEAQLRAIGGWKSGVVRKYVHIAAQDAKDVTARMNKKILGD
jgi:integrase